MTTAKARHVARGFSLDDPMFGYSGAKDKDAFVVLAISVQRQGSRGVSPAVPRTTDLIEGQERHQDAKTRDQERDWPAPTTIDD